MATPSPVLLLSATAAALGLHEFVLRRVEVDHLSLPIIVTASTLFWSTAYHSGFLFATSLAAAFWVPLTIWILLYRAFWHPLKNIPGPMGARLSKFWALKTTYETNFHYHNVLVALQKQYGDYVRTGPREVSIFDPAALQPVFGGASKTSKGPFYDVLEKSLHLNRDKPFHRQRRRIWDNGMKDSLADFAPRVEEFTEQLLTRLHKDNGKLVPLLDYATYYSYDVMTALAFGDAMGFIKGDSSGAADSILATFTNGLSAMGYMYHMPWLLNALTPFTSIAGPLKEWKDWSVVQMKARMAKPDTKPDFASHLINNSQDCLNILLGDSRLLVTAGSETTSTALTFTFMHLACHPHYMRAVRKEFREHLDTYHCDHPVPFLDAVIDESMRMWPSIFFGSQRLTPPEGLNINGHYIPGDTIVTIPPFVMYRDERNFARPNEFIPERWTTMPELVHNKTAFQPFSMGSYSCAGKALAKMELRSVIGRVINEFDVVLPEGFDEKEYFANVKDHMSSGPPPQMVRFVKLKE
ncbi:cytochrome P450 [Massarina eburnea CBS 473.64]|uniref:Cytochrome P450 n=1 Tax=Massarina eburnea CBS 473.64 TaxID=1395130 RepID=A0A6A6SBT7_9PLEO|nr:cytochrome P450 [Massarina eburnea CBS 473.64]